MPTRVVSWPPCWVPVETKTPPGLPTSAPLAQRPPVVSKKACNCAEALPKRVPVPKISPSASARSAALATGMWAKVFLASSAPIFSRTDSGRVSATCRTSVSTPGTERAPSAMASASLKVWP